MVVEPGCFYREGNASLGLRAIREEIISIVLPNLGGLLAASGIVFSHLLDFVHILFFSMLLTVTNPGLALFNVDD